MGDRSVTPGPLASLDARLRDLCERADRGEPALSAFLTPREVMHAGRQLAARTAAGTALLLGGFPEAERRRLCLLPAYMEGLISPEALAGPAADAARALAEAGLSELSEAVAEAAVLLLVRGSGFRTLAHRDYLGSILALGVERDALGDLVCLSEHEAVVAAGGRMADFLADSLTRVACDAVQVRRLAPGELTLPERRMTPVQDTVASPRLDCVVAALGGLSRERAKAAILAGLVEVDYEPLTAPDTPLLPPVTLTIRGTGKFLVEELGEATRKGRMRVRGKKYE